MNETCRRAARVLQQCCDDVTEIPSVRTRGHVQEAANRWTVQHITHAHLHLPLGSELAGYPSHATTKTNRICCSASCWCNVIWSDWKESVCVCVFVSFCVRRSHVLCRISQLDMELGSGFRVGFLACRAYS